MSVAILTIGNELLRGRVVDSNTAWLCNRLSSMGIVVREGRTVGDDLKQIIATLHDLRSDHQLILITGGLGPTVDDLTRQALATVAAKPLREDAAVLAQLTDRYQKRGLPLSPESAAQACIPESAILLANPVGSAPGFILVIGDTTIACLPGVPNEMQAMFEQSLMAHLNLLLPKLPTAPQSLTVRLLGIAESQADQLARSWLAQLKTEAVSFGTQIRFPEVHLIFTAVGDQANPRLEQIRQLAKEQAAAWLFDFSPTPLEAVAHALLQQTPCSLAIAESCSGGALASRLLSQPGASDYFHGGVISYANQAKEDLLGVPSSILQTDGAVSRQCALAMAVGASTRLKAKVGMGLTGILGPGGGSYDKPVGLVYLAITGFNDSVVHRFELKRDRLMNRDELVALSLVELIRFVSKHSQGRIST